MAISRVIGEDTDTVIHETPGVMGGYPCIGNARIPVRIVVEAMHAHGIEGAYGYLPQLSHAQVDAALAYYRAYPARVNEDIETNNRAFTELIARTPSR